MNMTYTNLFVSLRPLSNSKFVDEDLFDQLRDDVTALAKEAIAAK